MLSLILRSAIVWRLHVIEQSHSYLCRYMILAGLITGDADLLCNTTPGVDRLGVSDCGEFP